MRKLWTRNRKFQSTSAFIQIYRLKVYLPFMMICDILHEHSAEYLVCRNVVSGCSSELLSMQCAPCASCSRHVGLLPAWGTIILCLDLGHRRWDQQQITCLSIDDGHGQLRQFLRSIFVQNYPSNREIAHFTCLWLNILPLSDSFDVWYLRNRKFRVSKVHVKTVVCGYLNSCRYLNRRIRH